MRPAAPATSQLTEFQTGNHQALLPHAATQHNRPSAHLKETCWAQAAKHRPLEKPQELKAHVKQQRKTEDREIWDAASGHRPVAYLW